MGFDRKTYPPHVLLLRTLIRGSGHEVDLTEVFRRSKILHRRITIVELLHHAFQGIGRPEEIVSDSADT